MKTRSIGALIVGLVAALAVGGSPAGAGTQTGPEIVDQKGDANFINGNGVVLNQSQVTPVDIGSADITKIWFETGYNTVTDVDETGTVTGVRHVPNALLVKIETAGPDPIRPSFGPTLIYRVPASILGCEVWFEAYVAGPASTPVDTPQRADIRKLTATCPGGATTITQGFSLSSAGSVLTMRFPFSALPYSSTQIVLGKDVEIRPIASTPHVRTALGGAATAPEIDWTRSMPTKFRIGSDLPSPVDCIATPEGHILCPDGTEGEQTPP